MATRIGPLSGYLSNVFKEAKEYGSAYTKASNASADYRPGADARAAKANKEQRAAQGQFLGALLQGRQYDKKGAMKKGKK